MSTPAQLVINLKPAPDVPKFSEDVPEDVRRAFEEFKNWCRDAERAIRILQSAHNQGI